MTTETITTSPQSDITTLQEARSTAYLDSRLAAKDANIDPSTYTIPNIDISPSFSPSLSARQAVADQIHAACITTGFFYITNHGIPESLCSSVLGQSERFTTTLTRAQKEKLHTRQSDLGLGWEPSEFTSIAGDVETKEAFNFAYEAAMDRTGGDGKYVNIDGTKDERNIWPEEGELPGFREVVGEYYGAVSCYFS